MRTNWETQNANDGTGLVAGVGSGQVGFGPGHHIGIQQCTQQSATNHNHNDNQCLMLNVYCFYVCVGRFGRLVFGPNSGYDSTLRSNSAVRAHKTNLMENRDQRITQLDVILDTNKCETSERKN